MFYFQWIPRPKNRSITARVPAANRGLWWLPTATRRGGQSLGSTALLSEKVVAPSMPLNGAVEKTLIARKGGLKVAYSGQRVVVQRCEWPGNAPEAH